MRIILPLLFTASSMMAALPSIALIATQSVEKEVKRAGPNGEQITDYVEAKTVIPGETVIYSFNIENDQAEPVTDLTLAMPVPRQVQFIEGSASKAGASLLYSADDGASFLTRDALFVIDDNGRRAAGVDDITHIQWKIAGPIAPGQSDRVFFKAKLR